MPFTPGYGPNSEPVLVATPQDYSTREGGGYDAASDHYGQGADPAPYNPALHKGVSLSAPDPFGIPER